MVNMSTITYQFIRDNGIIMRNMDMEKNILRMDLYIVEIIVEE